MSRFFNQIWHAQNSWKWPFARVVPGPWQPASLSLKLHVHPWFISLPVVWFIVCSIWSVHHVSWTWLLNFNTIASEFGGPICPKLALTPIDYVIESYKRGDYYSKNVVNTRNNKVSMALIRNGSNTWKYFAFMCSFIKYFRTWQKRTRGFFVERIAVVNLPDKFTDFKNFKWYYTICLVYCMTIYHPRHSPVGRAGLLVYLTNVL